MIHQLLTLQAERGADLAPDTVARELERGLREGGFSPGAQYEHRWLPQGQTLASTSSEHRLILHTWPERGAVTLDLYGEPERLAGLADHLARSLGCAPIQRLSRERP